MFRVVQARDRPLAAILGPAFSRKGDRAVGWNDFDGKHGIALDFATSTNDNRDMAKRRPKKLSDQVRQAIANSDLTRYRISKLTGIDQSQLSKFVNGLRGLSTDGLDRLGELLGLEITVRKRDKGR